MGRAIVQQMHFINSSSFAPDANDWLANSHYPRILHFFDRACNLINERGETSGADAPAGFYGLFIYWGSDCSNL
jgi:hypothetical protein